MVAVRQLVPEVIAFVGLVGIVSRTCPDSPAPVEFVLNAERG